jgi:hypothetical protein
MTESKMITRNRQGQLVDYKPRSALNDFYNKDLDIGKIEEEDFFDENHFYDDEEEDEEEE